MQNIRHDRAYVIHSRKYTDSKIIITFFSEHYGKFSGAFRVVKSKNKPYSLPQVFTLFEVTWLQGASLKTIKSIEPVLSDEKTRYTLVGQSLYCGIYLNELLQRLLSDLDSSPELFFAYQAALEKLSYSTMKDQFEVCLREFELIFLESLGYGIDFSCDSDGDLLSTTYRYGFVAQSGFTKASNDYSTQQPVFTAEAIRNIQHGHFDNRECLKTAKIICRLSIESLLGGKPLKSRELFSYQSSD